LLEDGIVGGRAALLTLPGIVALEGGLPIRVDGRVVGAVGVSGMASAQDGEVAAAGLAALEV
jgi:glc operon protein GlcG